MALLKKYEALPELHRKVVDTLTIFFCGFYKYNKKANLVRLVKGDHKAKEINVVLEDLEKRGLIVVESHYYTVPFDLKMELFPQLICQPAYEDLARYTDRTDFCEAWTVPSTFYLREYLISGFLKGYDKDGLKVMRYAELLDSLSHLYGYYVRMMEIPEYDKALLHSPAVFTNICMNVSRTSRWRLSNINTLRHFLTRLLPTNNRGVIFALAQIDFLQGSLEDAKKSEPYVSHGGHMILFSHFALVEGDYEKSVKLFEDGRVTGLDGHKVSKMTFDFFEEYLYWFNFLLKPEGLKMKNLEAFIKKVLKTRDNQLRFVLPLLYLVKNDYLEAQSCMFTFDLSNRMDLSQNSLFTLVQFFNTYMVMGELSDDEVNFARTFCYSLRNNGLWLLLNEMIFILEATGNEVPPDIAIPADVKLPPGLMSRVPRLEKWEQTLEGLISLVDPAADDKRKIDVDTRICYLVEPEKGYVQPLLQTCGATGRWTKGRNISLKRFKEQMVEGLTEQDKRVAMGISTGYGYRGSKEYFMNGDKVLPELCGHPFLFLYNNPDIPIELIKGEPDLITEETKKGIRLKTNITDSYSDVVVVKETQTRFKVVALNAQQRSAVRMINEGILIPAKGRQKLLKVVEQLSAIMSVQSDMVETSESTRAVEGDARLRIQILPMGDGLKAEVFVKPLGSVPPYLKPGIGGKAVYGNIDGERCQAVRNMEAEAENATLFSNELAQHVDADLSKDAVLFSDPYLCLHLLETIGRLPELAIVEWPEGERFKMNKHASFENLHLKVKSKGAWFELQGELKVDEETVLSIKDLLSLSRKGRGRFIEMKKNEFLALTEELKRQIDELDAFVSLEKSGVKVNRFAAHSIDELTKSAASFKADKSWKDFRKKVDATENVEVPIPSTLKAELRPYQEEGFRWMTRLHAWGAGACLADDMGLGKTVQAIGMLLHLAEKGPSLVVCPASVAPNWCSELRRFSPTLNPIVLKAGNREETLSALTSFDVLVITYGLLQSEEARISEIKWSMAILDEAHAIKNTQTKSSKAAMSIEADFKLALTGTPVQNHLGELWNLFNFCNPGLLGTLAHFTDRYMKNGTAAQKGHLKKLIAPFILRRTKNKVLDELPSKTEITFGVELSEAEMAFYEAVRRQAVEAIEASDGANGQKHIQALAEITRLRLACCNAALVNKEMHLPSSKLEAMLTIVEELRSNNHQALIFSQFVGHLSIVRQALDEKGITYQYLDGSTPIPEREKAVKAFQSGKSDLFLISLKAGGLGLNLTAADYVLHLDPWWNPAIEDQASDRAHRMGQMRPVTIYRLVAKNTIEEKIVQLHATKRDMANSLLEGTDQSARLSTTDLLELLREV
ncbi:superfamily II DNA/RNA helicases, SNF2 family [Geofilum rubicundum JCM 15548]|uniref:Superfamily II DNA/RNA helicases, SNF2 family n=1 Tax=Geofilum rubicundum JCM 15548 TaxID=1236989 RepID=A0A0E9LZ94_9BACT|nr:superfamily II DNA/RNA helicases, SNF2 family [Geofilum rubicundum JCM 15548]